MNKLSAFVSKNIHPKSSHSFDDESAISYSDETTPITGITSPHYNNDNKQEDPSKSQLIFTYLKQHCASVTIVILLLVIFALAGENASSQGEAVANLVEDKNAALKIQQRPCQIYLDESVKKVNIIQTSLGNPSAHWEPIACLVRNDNHPKFNSFDETQQWDWVFGLGSSESREPIEYGMPSAEIKVDFNTVAHPDREPIMGFGGAFTEASALNYMSLSQEGRSAVISLLFGKEGLGYSLGRVHMNSCDFSVKSYNFDNVDGDFDLVNFDTKVEHDVMSGMVEMMLQANGKLRDDWLEDGINIMASPWSPPAWMKSPTLDDLEGSLHAENMTGSALPTCLREGTGPDSRYAASWALYFSKFLEAYKNWGINLFAVTVQNEPQFPAPWEACAYDPDNEAAFIANHLGPVLRKDHPDVKLLIFDHNKDHAITWVSSILNASNPASEYVDGTAIHWYAGGMDRLLDGAQGAPNMHRLLSTLKVQNVKKNHLVLGSEACHCPSTGYAGGDLSVAWARAERYGHTILSDLAAGSNGWVEWNLVLDALGGPNHLGNMCDAPILTVPYRADGKHNITMLPDFETANFPFGPVVGDTRTREELDALGFPAEYLDKGIVVQPIFYYMGHISRYVRPGSRAVHALVDQTNSGEKSRTYLKTNSNNNTIIGGGINDLARAGVEITLWPCEGSTRQSWTLNGISQFEVYGHDWKGKATKTCIGKEVDPSFKGILLSPCDNSAGVFRIENSTNGTVKIVIENSSENDGDNCMIAMPLGNDGGAYGPRGGAQVSIGSCGAEAAVWKFNGNKGEIISNYFEEVGGEVCATTGWPFLQVAAFIGPDANNAKTIIILNEASEPANYILKNEEGGVFITNSIQSHSIQTIVL